MPYQTFNKANTNINIHHKVLHQSVEASTNTLQLFFDKALSNSEVPENLKLADTTPVFNKKDP